MHCENHHRHYLHKTFSTCVQPNPCLQIILKDFENMVNFLKIIYKEIKKLIQSVIKQNG